jgi:hypothetical protein
MSDHLSKAEEMIALTARLSALIEDDVSMLVARRPSALANNDADRTTALLLYGKAAAEMKSTGALTQLPANTKQRLQAVTARLHKALKEQGRLLLSFRHVTEGLVKAVADVVAARETPSVYAKSGIMARSSLANRSAAMTLNQAV